jgi:hypothetical protein
MVNLNDQELKETGVAALPPASIDTLRRLREDACTISSSADFKLQAQQRFLRRVLSPDAPTQNLLMVHGVGSGKTCTAIQIAEEYILRPEFQDKRVLVLANPAVQENFRNQIFDISRVTVDPEGLLLSKQCTGRRYLDILQRAQSQPLQWTDKTQREKLTRMANRILGEFYEFQGYITFGNMLESAQANRKPDDLELWIHETFDNRLVIIDEAHNLRETTETTSIEKIVSAALKRIVQIANGVTLVLLTATPMFDKFEEILDYMNLFLWNSRKQAPNVSLKRDDIFTESGDFKTREAESTFRRLCQDYISFVRGENPFTFPFRLPPSQSMIAPPDRKKDVYGKPIKTQRKYLTLVGSELSEFQASVLRGLTLKGLSESRVVCVYPENKEFRDVFRRTEGQYQYTGEKFLAPSKVGNYSAKFATVLKSIQGSKGIAFVYSNLVESGAQLFAMCLEEHGYSPAFGSNLLSETSGESPSGSRGKYAIFTSETSDINIKRALAQLRRRENMNGDDIRVIIASPKVSEGVDFRYVRQIHVLDPWFNMSRIEQVVGRGTRTCSHSLLPFEEQNCTVYLHVNRLADGQEVLDEYIYREIVEQKAIKIAKVKKSIMESAMDCTLEKPVNSLPADWLTLPVMVDGTTDDGMTIIQKRSQAGTPTRLQLKDMQAPTFLDDDAFSCKIIEERADPNHVRPLSAILDVKDEILDKLIELFRKKAIWKQSDLLTTIRNYDPTLVKYIIQNAIAMGFKLKDSHGRIGRLEAKNGVFAFAIGPNDTMLDRILPDVTETEVALEIPEQVKEEVPLVAPEDSALTERVTAHNWPDFARAFPPEVLEWYYVDHNLSADERKSMLLNLASKNSDKPYVKPLIVPGAEPFFVLGSGVFYNSRFETFVPIGEQKDSYNDWLKALKESFVAKKNTYFAAMKGDAVTFNISEKTLPIQRAPRSKTLGGRACTSYKEDILKAFAEFLGEPFPATLSGKPNRCMYIDLLIRKMFLAGDSKVSFWTTEQWAILNEPPNSNELRAKLI